MAILTVNEITESVISDLCTVLYLRKTMHSDQIRVNASVLSAGVPEA